MLSDYDVDGGDKDFYGMATKISLHSDGGIGFSRDDGNDIFGGDVFEKAIENGTAYEYEEWCYWEGKFELMQYTGLKDKNGVEIYEGDIVREYTGFSDEGGDYPVEYHANGFWLEGRDNEFGFGDESDMEVIGNIYENPELVARGRGDMPHPIQ